MNEISKVQDFCDDPSRNNFFSMALDTQYFFNGVAEVYQRSDMNKTPETNRIVSRVKNFYTTRKLDKEQLRGLRALVLGAKTYREILDKAINEWEDNDLPIPESKMGPDGWTISPGAPVMVIKFEGKDTMEFHPAGKGLEEQILVIENTQFRQLSEYILWPHQLKEYLIDFVSDHELSLKEIYMQFPKKKLLFYLAHIGVVWDLEECIECMHFASQQGLLEGWEVKPNKAWRKLLLKVHPDKPGGDAELTSKINRCRKLLQEEECLSEIRHRATWRPVVESASNGETKEKDSILEKFYDDSKKKYPKTKQRLYKPRTFEEFIKANPHVFRDKPTPQEVFNALPEARLKSVLRHVYSTYPDWWNWNDKQTLRGEVSDNYKNIRNSLEGGQKSKGSETTIASLYIAYLAYKFGIARPGDLIHDAWCDINAEYEPAKKLKTRGNMYIPFEKLPKELQDKDTIWIKAWWYTK